MKTLSLLVAICFTAFFACKTGPRYRNFKLTRQKNTDLAARKAQNFLNKQFHNLSLWSEQNPDKDSSDPQGVSFSDWGQTEALNKNEVADATKFEAIPVFKRTLKASAGTAEKKRHSGSDKRKDLF